MAVYIVAQLKFTRRELYDRYQSRFMGVFRKFRGKLLVADEHPVVLEGEWPRDKRRDHGISEPRRRRNFRHRRSTRRSRSIARRGQRPSC